MNRKQRRDLEKQVKRINKVERRNHKPLTNIEHMLGMMAINRVKRGVCDSNDIEILRNSKLVHLDNEMACPEGTRCKLNSEEIFKRPQKDLSEKFKDWVQANKDKDFTITRDGASNSLVCLAEDETEPKWLFDLYTDLLIYDEATESYVPLETLEVKEEDELFGDWEGTSTKLIDNENSEIEQKLEKTEKENEKGE